jgi:hypothetical protein
MGTWTVDGGLDAALSDAATTTRPSAFNSGTLANP